MSTITISFSKNLPSTNGIEVLIETPIMKHENAWIWDHYFCLVLNRLPAAEAEALLSEISQWALTITQNLTKPVEVFQEEDLFTVGKQPVYHQMTETEIEIFIEVSSQAGQWPAIHSRLPDDASNNQLSHSTFALANAFLNDDNNFIKELPLHIIAMKKYFSEQESYTNEKSISSAPAYAFDIAMQFQKSLNK